MRLTVFSDYALRILVHAGTHPNRLVTVTEIADSYRISRHHLIKVVQLLVQNGFVETVRGRSGGLRLARAPEEINVGALVRCTEPDFDLVECFDPRTNSCLIAPACDLKAVLHEARDEFMRVLDTYTLADLLVRRRKLAHMFAKGRPATG
ncbi:MAG: Rrf2 family transcriptional regulator [Planctomycetes bacterium]|nr:Rrf2 family transcriptional regulator [Planctomycetota bacterium]